MAPKLKKAPYVPPPPPLPRLSDHAILKEYSAFIEKQNTARSKAGLTLGEWQVLLGEMITDLHVRARKAYDVEQHLKPKKKK